jgi:hypothetical protein
MEGHLVDCVRVLVEDHQVNTGDRVGIREVCGEVEVERARLLIHDHLCADETHLRDFVRWHWIEGHCINIIKSDELL